MLGKDKGKRHIESLGMWWGGGADHVISVTLPLGKSEAGEAKGWMRSLWTTKPVRILKSRASFIQHYLSCQPYLCSCLTKVFERNWDFGADAVPMKRLRQLSLIILLHLSPVKTELQTSLSSTQTLCKRKI
jgi:hypothetical protein